MITVGAKLLRCTYDRDDLGIPRVLREEDWILVDIELSSGADVDKEIRAVIEKERPGWRIEYRNIDPPAPDEPGARPRRKQYDPINEGGE